MYKWIPLIIAIGLALVLYTAIGKDPTKLETARLNDPIPDFQLFALQDESRSITQDDLKGQVLLLNVCVVQSMAICLNYQKKAFQLLV